MISAELLKQIRRIQIFTSRAVNDVFAGEYESVFKGRGMQFDEVREYTPGDDVRSIDWNVTARTGAPHIKRYVEERELTVMLLVDLSGSGDFGTVNKLKNELTAELSAILAFSAIKNNDKVGMIIYTDHIERFIPPQKGARHVLRVIRELLYHEPMHRGTDIGGALDYLARVIRKRATIFLLSDFLTNNHHENGTGRDLKHTLALINKRHDLIAVQVRDQAERTLPRAGLIELEDAETGQRRLVDMGSKRVREAFARQMTQRDTELNELFRSAGVDVIQINTGRPYINDLVRFFKMREKRR